MLGLLKSLQLVPSYELGGVMWDVLPHFVALLLPGWYWSPALPGSTPSLLFLLTPHKHLRWLREWLETISASRNNAFFMENFYIPRKIFWVTFPFFFFWGKTLHLSVIYDHFIMPGSKQHILAKETIFFYFLLLFKLKDIIFKSQTKRFLDNLWFFFPSQWLFTVTIHVNKLIKFHRFKQERKVFNGFT